MKERFLKKWKSISTLTTLKQSLIQVKSFPLYFQAALAYKDKPKNTNPPEVDVPGNFSPSKLQNDVKLEHLDSEYHTVNNENFIPSVQDVEETQIMPESRRCNVCATPLSDQLDVSSMQPSNIQSVLSDSKPLRSSLKPTIIEHSSATTETKEENDEFASLVNFEEKCLPRGDESFVILYTTSLRGIRKTFEDCYTIRFLLESLHILFLERDISMHLEFREELWKIMGGRVIPPRLFIKGKYIGGADEVVSLHEQGRLRKLLHGVPKSPSIGPCNGCGGVRFVLCSNCNGSCKITSEGEAKGLIIRCPECNENGLVKCHLCCRAS